MDRQPMIDLKRDNVIDHEITHLVRIVKIDDCDDVRSVRIVAPWADFERCVGKVCRDELLEFSDRLLDGWMSFG